MRKLPLYILLSVIISIFGACQKDVPKSVIQQDIDTITKDTIANHESDFDDSELPDSADKVFNDFIELFISSKKYQASRIQFPLSYIVDGKESKISKNKWKYDPMHKGEDVYTMIFDGTNTLNKNTDSIPSTFLVERIDLENSRIKQYRFNKLKNLWMLTTINEHDFEENANCDFYTFYQKFVADENFQIARILSSFNYKTYDNETGEIIEGTLEPEQWLDVCPELPSGIVTNFSCGEINPKSNKRTFSICSSSTEMNTIIEFRHWGGKWMLISLEQ